MHAAIISWNDRVSSSKRNMIQDFKGILPAIASPCDEADRFLEDAFAALAETLYAQGVHGLYVCGSTGDTQGMRPDERKRAVEIAVEISRNHNGMVIAHVGAANTRDSVELAEHAAVAGADAVSGMPPANRTHAQLLDYYEDIARAGQLPLFVYYIPGLSGHRFTVEEMEALLDIDGVAGFKISDWDLFYMTRVLRARPEAIVFNGNDEFLLPGLLYGARGGIGMNYNLFPRLFTGIYEAFNRKNLQRAQELQRLFLAYADVFFRYGGIRPNLETLMRDLGLAPFVWRRPRPERDEETNRRFLAEVRPAIEAIEAAVGKKST